jgi:hypothetical protein
MILVRSYFDPLILICQSFGCLIDMSTRQVWMGMDSISKNAFAWINSAAMDVVNWATGMPTSVKKEACVAIKHEISIFLLYATS